MAKAIKAEITAMGNSNLVSALRKDADDARALCRAIDNFVSTSSRKLTGVNYDEARAIAAQYIPILQSRAKTSEAMADAIKNGCSSLSSYMGKYAILDETLRFEYEARLKEAESALARLRSISFIDDEFNLFSYWNSYFTYKRIIEECKEYLAKLDGLAGADASAFQAVSTAANSFVTR